jgi:hypothetical protein
LVLVRFGIGRRESDWKENGEPDQEVEIVEGELPLYKLGGMLAKVDGVAGAKGSAMAARKAGMAV